MAVATAGFFDGLHRGHRLVIDTLLSEADSRGEESVVITFWPHPRLVLKKDAGDLRLLMSLQEKIDALREQGVERVEVIPFTEEFASLSSGKFLRDWVVGKYACSLLVVGYDNRLGRNAATFAEIEAEARKLGLEVKRAPRLDAPGAEVSSSLVREALFRGRVADAARMLGKPYSIKGVITDAGKKGCMRLIVPDRLKCVPRRGIYSTEVLLPWGRYPGQTVISGNCDPLIETSLNGYGGELEKGGAAEVFFLGNE